MSSPKTLDFPLPPPRGSIPTTDLRSPPPVPFSPSLQQQQLSKILDLTNRYRTQAVALLARQEALQTEQKNVFELERQLWVTEREIWEEERRILTSGLSGGGAIHGEKKDSTTTPIGNSTHPMPMLSPNQLNHTTRFLSVSSMAESQADPGYRQRQSSGGGSGIGWFLKQGTPTAASVPLPNESVSPKGTRPKQDSPRYGSISEMSLVEPEIPEEAIDDDDLAEIPHALITEATKLVYGEKVAKRGSFSSNGTTKRPVLFTTLSDNPDSVQKSLRRASSSTTVKYPTAKNAQYLAAFSDEDLSDDNGERDTQTPQPPKPEQRVRKRSASHADKTSDEPPIPLRLRPASNFGTAFGSSAGSLRGQQTLQPPPRAGSILHSTFYHPETPVDNFSHQHSFRDASWNGGPKVSDDSLGGKSNNSNVTVKQIPQPITIKATPWGVASTNLTSPTFGKDMSQGLKPPHSPSNLTSSLSISSSQNSPARVPIPSTDNGFSTSSRYTPEDSSRGDGPQNGTHGNGEQKGKTSPPTYTWMPPPPRPTSPAHSAGSSRRSGLYGHTILLSPSTVAPSMKTADPRLSAVGGIPPFSPTLGRMGTSSMLLSVSSRSENGDDDDDEELDSDEERGSLNGHTNDGRIHSTTSMEVPMRLGGGVVTGTTGGANGESKVRTVDGFVEPPIEIVKDSGRWGNVIPGGMI
ncbi:hypothetical protein ABW19_dt0207422 [Dactylella cylindrospora]|nr:hypothetical protein ABW19_dt0207422 [Dactylella cylindrospora]